MQFIRKSTLVAAAALFTVSLFWFITLFGLGRILGSAAPLKQALRDSGIYKTVISDVLAQTQKDQNKKPVSPGEQHDTGIPLTDPAVQNLIHTSFPPSFLQEQTEKILDGSFAWLKGDTPKLSFTIDVASAKMRLADGLGAYAHDKAATLPPCAAGTAPAGEGTDILNATCLPPGATPDTLAAAARKQILEGEFLKDATLSADSLKNSEGKTLDEQLRQAPTAYRRIQHGVIWLGVLSALLGLAVLVLSASWRSGVRKLAVISIVVGVLQTLLSIMTGLGTKAIEGQFAKNPDMDQPLQHSMFRVAQQLANDARAWWLWIGVALIAAGIAALVALRLTKSTIEAGEKVQLPAGEDAIGKKTQTSEPTTPKPASFDKPKDKPRKETRQRP